MQRKHAEYYAAADKALVEYAEGDGKHVADSLLKVCPALAEAGDLVGVPDNLTKTLALHPDCPARAAQLVSFVHSGENTASSSTLAASLDSAWGQMHRMVENAQCPPVRGLPKEPLCIEMGRCLCRGEGLILKRLHGRIHRALKLLLPFRSAARDLAMTGDYFLLLQGKGHAAATGDSGAAAGSSTEQAETTVELAWHMSLLYLSPWRPTWQEMGIAGVQGGYLHLRATSHFWQHLMHTISWTEA